MGLVNPLPAQLRTQPSLNGSHPFWGQSAGGIQTVWVGSVYYEHLGWHWPGPSRAILRLLTVCPREHPTDTLGSAEVRPGTLGNECVWAFIFLGC
jgi:hypothetical protein